MMKYLKIKATDKRIIIIDLEKVVSYMVGDDFVNINYYGDDFFHFTREDDKFGIQVEKFETLRVFIQNLAGEKI
nr:MAG TPA: Picornavirus coat protein (VP4) [Caudoviricetes sp.]